MATFSNRPQNTIKEKLLFLTKNICDPFIRQKKIFSMPENILLYMSPKYGCNKQQGTSY
jgi:hypothetical protein